MVPTGSWVQAFVKAKQKMNKEKRMRLLVEFTYWAVVAIVAVALGSFIVGCDASTPAIAQTQTPTEQQQKSQEVAPLQLSDPIKEMLFDRLLAVASVVIQLCTHDGALDHKSFDDTFPTAAKVNPIELGPEKAILQIVGGGE